MATKRGRTAIRLATVALTASAAYAMARAVAATAFAACPRDSRRRWIPTMTTATAAAPHRRRNRPVSRESSTGPPPPATSRCSSPKPGAVLRCGTCDAVTEATTFERRWQNRLEGASDPDDMAQVSGLVCPACGVQGTFVSLFGPGAGTDAADVMVALPRPLGDLPIVAT